MEHALDRVIGALVGGNDDNAIAGVAMIGGAFIGATTEAMTALARRGIIAFGVNV